MDRHGARRRRGLALQVGGGNKDKGGHKVVWCASMDAEGVNAEVVEMMGRERKEEMVGAVLERERQGGGILEER